MRLARTVLRAVVWPGGNAVSPVLVHAHQDGTLTGTCTKTLQFRQRAHESDLYMLCSHLHVCNNVLMVNRAAHQCRRFCLFNLSSARFSSILAQ